MCRLGHTPTAVLALLLVGCDGPTVPNPPEGGSPPGGVPGSVSLVSETRSCTGSSDACWEVVVSCPGLAT
jgi:hypothetical protein